MKPIPIELSDFKFYFDVHGKYKVIYTDPMTEARHETITGNMPLIDLTKNAEKPKEIDLEMLKRLCKRDRFWFA